MGKGVKAEVAEGPDLCSEGSMSKVGYEDPSRLLE